MNRTRKTQSIRRFAGPMLLMLSAALAINANWAAEKSHLSVRQRQFAQQQARATATELVSNILDTQLRQFKENKLDKLPAYADIDAMRRNLDRLVDADMQAVIGLLIKAEQMKEPERQAVLTQARTAGREVVVALLSEQQRLRERMRLAKIASQARQLIELETHVLTDTRQLPELPPAEREQTTLERLEDQRDIGVLHAQLLSTLQEVQKWEGATGTVAKQGLTLLNNAHVDQELKKADEGLNANRFVEAAKAEEAAIKGWKALLDVIEEAQGLNNTNHDMATKAVEELIHKQLQLRDETKSAQLDDVAQSEKLAEQQHSVQEQVEQLSEKLPPNPSAHELAKAASDAAEQAETSIFEAKQEPAVQQQQQVIDALAEIAKKLEQESPASAKAQSDQLTQKAESLEKSKQPPDAQNEKKPGVPRDAKAELTEESKQCAQQANSKEKGDATKQTEQQDGIPVPGSKPAARIQSDGSANSSPPSLKSEPWFVKLPPDIQKSIQARARRPAPRGYEERLKRYFESD